jgi:hypothetical protein
MKENSEKEIVRKILLYLGEFSPLRICFDGGKSIDETVQLFQQPGVPEINRRDLILISKLQEKLPGFIPKFQRLNELDSYYDIAFLKYKYCGDPLQKAIQNNDMYMFKKMLSFIPVKRNTYLSCIRYNRMDLFLLLPELQDKRCITYSFYASKYSAYDFLVYFYENGFLFCDFCLVHVIETGNLKCVAFLFEVVGIKRLDLIYSIGSIEVFNYLVKHTNLKISSLCVLSNKSVCEEIMTKHPEIVSNLTEETKRIIRYYSKPGNIRFCH